jgi:hypothetical protein
MTVQELREIFNREFGLDNKWPATYEVDMETYVNVCNDCFFFMTKKTSAKKYKGFTRIHIAVGKNYGILFKGVELLVKK